MKRLLATLAAVMIGLTFAVSEAEASKRIGGGKNVGSQRDNAMQRQATPPAGAPGNPAAAAAAPAAAGAAAAATQRAGMSRWLAPMAGLAAGLGLAYLFGDQLGSLLMTLLLVAAIAIALVFAFRMFARRNAPQAAAQGAYGNTSRYQGMEPARAGGALGGAATGAAAAPVANASNVPAGFDVDGFLAQAKQAFNALQTANDKADVEALRDMTTEQMFAAIKGDLDARVGGQQVDVVRLDAELLEVSTEGNMHWASVKFSGSMRESADALPERFEEIWNLQKPTDGSAGWMLAGIQQTH